MGKRKSSLPVEISRGVPDRDLVSGSGWCRKHDKVLFASRRWAKAAIRVNHGKGMNTFICDEQDGMWHTGHVSPLVTAGILTRGQWRASGVRARPELLANPVRAQRLAHHLLVERGLEERVSGTLARRERRKRAKARAATERGLG